MKIVLRNNKDFFAGLIFAVIGLTVVVIALRTYHIGTRLNMGPGYFPVLMGGVLAAFGLYILVRGLFRDEKIAGVWALRPLAMVSLGIMSFGFCIDRFGMIPSLAILIFICALGGRQFKVKEAMILIPLMIMAAWAIFVCGLGLPMRPFIWEY